MMYVYIWYLRDGARTLKYISKRNVVYTSDIKRFSIFFLFFFHINPGFVWAINYVTKLIIHLTFLIKLEPMALRNE